MERMHGLYDRGEEGEEKTHNVIVDENMSQEDVLNEVMAIVRKL